MRNHEDRITSVIKSNLCDYSDAYIHVKGTIPLPNTGKVATLDNSNKKIKIKKLCSFS